MAVVAAMFWPCSGERVPRDLGSANEPENRVGVLLSLPNRLIKGMTVSSGEKSVFLYLQAPISNAADKRKAAAPAYIAAHQEAPS
jgi:hypothetical protein